MPAQRCAYAALVCNLPCFPSGSASGGGAGPMKLMDFHRIPPFYADDPDEPFAIHVIVETPRGSGHKFAYNEKYGVLELSRILRSGMVWPCDFGFVPQTLGADGDPLDVALL